LAGPFVKVLVDSLGREITLPVPTDDATVAAGRRESVRLPQKAQTVILSNS